MLRSMKDLENCAIAATDGVIGKEKDFLFDDLAWVIRYFVVETGSWLSSRQVLISPIAVQKPNWIEKILPVLLNKEQVKNSPTIDHDKPVSRQNEASLLDYYGYPYYWVGKRFWGGGIYPYLLYRDHQHLPHTEAGARSAQLTHHNVKSEDNKKADPNLRSCKEVIGYHINANDGDIGHVSGLLVEETTWAVRYLIIDTSNWWDGHKVLVPPEWISEVCWLDNTISVDLNRQVIKDAPEYDYNLQITPEFETAIYQHYELAGYWAKVAKAKKLATN